MPLLLNTYISCAETLRINCTVLHVRNAFEELGRIAQETVRKHPRAVNTGLAAAALGGVIGIPIYIATREPTHQEQRITAESLPFLPVYYCQIDPQWQGDPHWKDGRATCAPTAIAMLMTGFGDLRKPPDVDTIFQKKNYRPDATSATMIRNADPKSNDDVLGWLTTQRYIYKPIHDTNANLPHLPHTFNFETAKQYIKEGNLILASGKVKFVEWGPKDKKGNPLPLDHVFLITDVDPEKKTMTILDPANQRPEPRILPLSESYFEGGFLTYSYAIKPGKELAKKLVPIQQQRVKTGEFPMPQPEPTPTPKQRTISPEELVAVTTLFKDINANKLAQSYGYTPETFFRFSSEHINNLTAVLGNDLYPIFPPSVMEYKDLIYTLSSRYNVPPNIIAFIMTVESGGVADIKSPDKAYGLFQVLEQNFDTDYQGKTEHMTNPTINGNAGMDYFTRWAVPYAFNYVNQERQKKNLPPLDKPDTETFGRALIGYNGGQERERAELKDIPEQSKHYREYFFRFAMTAQIAQGLREKGYTDSQIINALSSETINARAYALGAWINKRNRNYSRQDYETAITQITQPIPGVTDTTITDEELYEYYQAYLKKTKNSWFLSPGISIWVEQGGRWLLSKSETPDNFSIDAWQKMDTKRK